MFAHAAHVRSVEVWRLYCFGVAVSTPLILFVILSCFGVTNIGCHRWLMMTSSLQLHQLRRVRGEHICHFSAWPGGTSGWVCGPALLTTCSVSLPCKKWWKMPRTRQQNQPSSTQDDTNFKDAYLWLTLMQKQIQKNRILAYKNPRESHLKDNMSACGFTPC